jgi:hypothetical protein
VTDSITLVVWCSACASEPALEGAEVEINGEWVPIGTECLTRLGQEDTM